ncbi:MAG: hypothetical protein M1165_02905 [Candidatus Pacearchaeota archaeon]|nr:hypothetical protein [Candidatus Pacearchaeota archaeon]
MVDRGEPIFLTAKQKSVLEWRLNNMCFKVVGQNVYVDRSGKKKDFSDEDIIAFITNGTGIQYRVSFNPDANFKTEFYKSIREACNLVKFY